MVGGIIRFVIEKLKASDEEKDRRTNNGILFCSGMIAGEGLVGILLALLAVFGVGDMIDISSKLSLSSAVMDIGGIVLFGIIILTVLGFALGKKKKS